MGIARGPNIIKDNLVFGYDTGYGVADNETSTRFYPGRPTTNYVTDSSILQGGWGGSHSLIDSATKSFQLNVNGFHTDGAGWRSFMWDMRAHVGSAVTISATIEVPSNSPGNFAWVMMGQANSGGSGTSTNNYLGYSPSSERVTKSSKNTERISWSGTIGNTGTANQPNGIIGFTVWYNGGTNNTNSFIKVSNVQIEKISHETPFVNGTRPNTAGLIDLKKTTNINVSSVSFNSTGQPIFDGTDDEINTGITTQLTDFSCVVIFKDNGSAAWGRLVDKMYTTGFFISSYFATGGNNYVGAGVIEPSSPHGQSMQYDDTKYNYFVLTRSGATHTIYLNGSTNKVQKTNGSSATLSSTEMAIGAWQGSNNSQRYTGEIPVVKLYNKELTTAEIEQDFNTYKNRFNI